MATGSKTQLTSTAANPNTTLKSTGGKTPLPKMDQEAGANALTSGLIEYVPELTLGLPAIQTYLRMYWQDAQVRTTIRAAMTPVLGANWYVKPFSPEPDDMVIRDFCAWNLFQGMSIPWSKVLQHACSCIYLGAAVDELVWTQRPWVHPNKGANSKNMITLQKIAPRVMSTIQKFNYDQNGGPAGVTHTKYNPSDPNSQPQDVDIPIEKLLIFSYDQQSADLRGLSVLRSAYKHWYYKENFYKIDGVQKERHGAGVPLIELPPGFDDDDLAFAQQLGRGIRTNERGYILQPPGWKISFAQLSGNMVDALESAMHHDMMIARNILVQFINMGGSASGSSGGRAQGAVLLDLFLMASKHFATLIADVFNQYLIPQLVSYNFNVDKYPEIAFKGIGDEKDQQAMSAALRNLAQAGLITLDGETEDWIREQFDMPAATGILNAAQQAAKKAQQIQKTTGVNPQPDAQKTDPNAPPVDQGKGRPPTGQPGAGSQA